MPVLLVACGRPDTPDVEACLRHHDGLEAIESVVVLTARDAPSDPRPGASRADVVVVPGGTAGWPTWDDVAACTRERLAGRLLVVVTPDVRLDGGLEGLASFYWRETCLVAGPSGESTAGGRFAALAFEAPFEAVEAPFAVGGTGASGCLAHVLAAAHVTVRDVRETWHVARDREAAARVVAEAPGASGPVADVPPPVGDGPKVFGLGLQRTGTASLRRAFNVLSRPTMEVFGPWFLVSLVDGRIVFDPKPNHRFYGGFADSPVPQLFRELDAAFPGSRFVLTVRDPDRWLRSVKGLFKLKAHWDKSPFGETINAYHRLEYGRETFSARDFRRAYEEHGRAVREHFAGRPDDLLVLDAREPDKWGRLCGFLGVPVPDEPYPRLNAPDPPTLGDRVRRILGMRPREPDAFVGR